MEINAEKLIQWEKSRLLPNPKKQSVTGVLFIICMILGILAFGFHGNFQLPYPFVPLCFIGLAILFYLMGVIKYKADESRLKEEEAHCPNCGKRMEEYIVDMRTEQLDKADLSKWKLLHKFIKKNKLYQGHDGRIYMTGLKSSAPGQGYPSWDKTAFSLKTKWLVCTDCSCSFIQDTIFEIVARKDVEIESLLKDKKEIRSQKSSSLGLMR